MEKNLKERINKIFFKNKKKKYQEDLNQKVCRYRRWWQDQNEECSSPRPSAKKNKKSLKSGLKVGEGQKVWDDSFVYYEGN
ncbi:MAG: hypothetical protein ACE5K2_09720 [Candidatus Zixiibacteriota bacterium]